MIWPEAWGAPPPLCPSECIELGRCMCHWSPTERAEFAEAKENARKKAAGLWCDPLAPDGLFIAGVATTRGWDRSERLLHGRDPRRQLSPMPLPLYLGHDHEKRLGEMYECSADSEALYFRACIVPPGTAGYDRALLEQVWEDVRTGAAAGVSLAADWPALDGSFRGTELSVCPKGANPFAVIMHAVFPDGFERSRPAPVIDYLTTVRASDDHHLRAALGSPVTKEARPDRITALETEVAALRERLDAVRAAPMQYQGSWAPGKVFRKGQCVTWGGSLWHASEEGTTSKPGDGRAWDLVARKGQDMREPRTNRTQQLENAR